MSSRPSSTRSAVTSSSPTNCWNPSSDSSRDPTLKYVAKHRASIAIGKYTLKPSDTIDITSMWPITCVRKVTLILQRVIFCGI